LTAMNQPYNAPEPIPTSHEEDPVKSAWEAVVMKNLPPKSFVRPIIQKSWRWCRKNGIDPFEKKPPPVISKAKLDKLHRQNQDLIEISKPVMEMIEISVRGTGFIVTIADRKVRVLETLGDTDILKMARKRKYVPGCLRETVYSGTNAIALALETGKPIQLTGAEHYNVNYHQWTCSSAPIKDNQGKIIGLITLSGHSMGRHKHTLALVSSAASTIESQLRVRALVEKDQRLNSMLKWIYNSLTDGFIAIDNTLEITHLNSTALAMLKLNNVSSVIGRRLDEIAILDDNFMQTFENKEHFDPGEINFKSSEGIQTYMCRVDPIQSEVYKLMGMILIMSEKRQMINMVKKISGNYAKYEFKDIKGADTELKRQIELARIASKTNSRVLICSESGTGKELFAQAIHNHSNRSKEPFVAISCAAIPRDLIESELFGYKGGAFTGAKSKGMMGKFELANKGTLFLDEVNGLSLELQAKLLRVLQQNEITRLGDTRTIPVDVRIIAASNADLLEEVELGNFREDLYYRINVVEIFIPPLRDRKDDIKLLVHHIMDRQSREMNIAKPRVSTEALKVLKNYPWSGNIRELENVCERALLLSQGQTIRKGHLPLRHRRIKGEKTQVTKSINQNNRELILTTLQRCGGNSSMAARKLKIARSTLYRKLKEYGISK
jgi:sigma-54 dependent transcriptional regulator, acetoin dehydrogenase operon transcriptional activator AcoR